MNASLINLSILAETGFFDLSFWQSIVSNLAATFVGVALGVWTALSLEGRKTSKTAKQKKEQLITLLHGSLQKNLNLLEQMSKELPAQAIYYNVDIELLEATASLKYETIDDLDFNREIDQIRYELLHLHRKVDLQLQLAILGGRPVVMDPVAMHSTLRASILSHIAPIKDAIRKMLEKMSASRSRE